jgi:hypothetical protein
LAKKDDVLTKHLRVPQGTAEIIPVERAKWNRLKRRIQKLDQRPNLQRLSNFASVCAAFGSAAFFAAIGLPIGKHTGIEPWVRPGLFVFAAFSLLVAATFHWLAQIERRRRGQERADIVDEMEAEEAAWRTTDPAAGGSSG